MAAPEGYPVEWRGQTLYLSDLTRGVKKAFVKWAKAYLTREGIENLGDRPEVLNGYLASLYGNVWWADGPMSDACHKLLSSADGGRQLNRLLFGDSVRHFSDDDLDELLDAKEADPASDYMVAMKIIKEEANPKVHSGPAPGGRTGATPTTSGNPSTAPATNSTP